MSSTIIYHQVGLCIPRSVTGHADDLVAIVSQAGPSNCYESGGRRVRSWQSFFFGSEAMVMQQAIRFAADCAGGMIKMRHAGGDVTPEQYITSTRNLLKKAVNHDITKGPVPFKDGHISCHFEHGVVDPEAPQERQKQRFRPGELQPLVKDPTFWEVVETSYAHTYLKVSGPELRASCW